MRGKQFELIAIRESAGILARSQFVPIIEPVKESLGGLQRTVNSVCDASGRVIVIVNPYHGDHQASGVGITSLLENQYRGSPAVIAGILLKKDLTVSEVVKYYRKHRKQAPVFIHAGFTEAKSLIDSFGPAISEIDQIFLEEYCGKLYRKHFAGCTRILLRDGFRRRRNADQPSIEEFSDLHITFTEEGMDGFGDFLIVGDDYNEGGGPAYAVAIHLTFINHAKDDAMYIYHFVSDTRDTPTDPAGKFGEALNKLIRTLNAGKSGLLETSAIKEFRELHRKGHFPGLGYVKKLSMKHHIETLADYLT